VCASNLGLAVQQCELLKKHGAVNSRHRFLRISVQPRRNKVVDRWIGYLYKRLIFLLMASRERIIQDP
jgi:hypothetical protein